MWTQQIDSICRNSERQAYLASMPPGARAMKLNGERHREEVLAALQERGGVARICEIAKDIGLSDVTVRSHLLALAAEGVCEMGRARQPWRIK